MYDCSFGKHFAVTITVNVVFKRLFSIKGFLGMKKNEIAIKEEKANLPGPCGIIHFTCETNIL